MKQTPQQFQQILEQQATSVLCLDSHLNVTYMNSAAEMLFSTSSNKAQNNHIEELAHFPDIFLIRIADTLGHENPITEREISFVRPDIKKITVDCCITPFYNEAGSPQIIIELHKINERLRIAQNNALLAQQVSSKKLLRGIAHEIKNPLGGLRGAAQLLELELEDKSLHEYTSIIIREADRLHSLIDRLLGPRKLPKLQAINIHEVTEYIRTLIQAEVSDKISLIADYDPSIPEFTADREYLIQVILNIASNAQQAVGSSGTIVFKTRVARYQSIGNKLHKLVGIFEVIDDGPGIPDSLKESLFYPMTTGRADGTGLGLSIAQSLINQHNGIIEHSRLNNKTYFSIIIPLETPPRGN